MASVCLGARSSDRSICLQSQPSLPRAGPWRAGFGGGQVRSAHSCRHESRDSNRTGVLEMSVPRSYPGFTLLPPLPDPKIPRGSSTGIRGRACEGKRQTATTSGVDAGLSAEGKRSALFHREGVFEPTTEKAGSRSPRFLQTRVSKLQFYCNKTGGVAFEPLRNRHTLVCLTCLLTCLNKVLAPSGKSQKCSMSPRLLVSTGG